MTAAELTTIRQMLASLPATDNPNPAETRAIYDQVGGSMAIAADVVHETVSVHGLAGEWSRSPGADPSKVVLYLHGGGYVIGSITSHRAMVAEIGRASGARTFAIDYRLAPEYPFPAAVEDAVGAYRHLLDHGIDPAHICVAGDSAGGGLTIATLLDLRDRGLPLPRAAWCVSPWIDLQATGATMDAKAAADPMVQRAGLLRFADAYMGGQDPRQPLASPLHADLKGLPPILIQVGSAETLLDDALALARLAGLADVPATLEIWPDMIHVWHFFAPMLSEGRDAIAQGGAWVKARLA